MTKQEKVMDSLIGMVIEKQQQLTLYRGVAEMKDVSIYERFIYTYIKTSDLDPQYFRGTDVYVKGLGIPKITFNKTIQKLIKRGWVNQEGRGVYSLVPNKIF